MRCWLKFMVAVSVFLLMGGCTNLDLPSSQPVHFQKQPPWQRQLRLAKLQHWIILGAFSVRQAKKAEIVNYRWQQFSANRYVLDITSSLDVFQARVVGRENRVSLLERDKKITANTPEALLQKSLGYSLPMTNLYYWIRGLPAPGLGIRHHDQYGHLIRLQQSGWVVTYRDYINKGQVDLPRLITLRRKNLAIKVAIKQWDI